MFATYQKLAKVIQKKRVSITFIRSDLGRDFQNEEFKIFSNDNGIRHNFCISRNSPKNGVEDKEKDLWQSFAKIMLNYINIPKYFWDDVVSTVCYVMNCVLIRAILNHTPYKIYKGRNLNISHLHIFWYKCFILNNEKVNLGKFDAKANEGIFIRYSTSFKAFRTFNKRILTIEQLDHVIFDEYNPKLIEFEVVDRTSILEKTNIEENYKNQTKDKVKMKNQLRITSQILHQKIQIFRNNGGQQETILSRTFLEISLRDTLIDVP